MAQPTLRKSSSVFTPPQTILKSQTKAKTPNPALAAQLSLVGVTSSVIEEYDLARPNDYEEYRRERKKRVMEVEVWRELEPSVKKKKKPPETRTQ